MTEVAGHRCNREHPPEDPADGCPAGWALSPYVISLFPYLRDRAEGGQRISNPIFDRLRDDAIVQAIQFYERQQERCLRHTMMIEDGARRQDG